LAERDGLGESFWAAVDNEYLVNCCLECGVMKSPYDFYMFSCCRG